MRRASCPLFAASVALASLCALATPAAAQPKVAALGIQPAGTPAGLAQRCSAALGTHLKEAGYKRVQGKSLVEIKLVFGCVNEGAACMAKVGKNLNADKLLWGTLSKKRDRFVLSLSMLDVASKKLRKARRTYSQKAFSRDPEGTVRKAVEGLLPAQIGTIKLSSSVSGAEVLLDGRPMGPINDQGLDMQVSAGAHTLQVRRDGYRAWVKRVTVRAGETLPLAATLELIDRGTTPPVGTDKPPVAVTPKGKDARTGWKVAFYIATSVTVGLGVGLVVNGLGVLNNADDKDAVLRDNTDISLNVRRNGCDAKGQPGYEKIESYCDSGEQGATIQNIMIGGIAVSALVSAFFFYKAYLASGSSSGDEDVAHIDHETGPEKIELPAKTAKLDWSVTPSVGPQGAHLGFSLTF